MKVSPFTGSDFGGSDFSTNKNLRNHLNSLVTAINIGESIEQNIDFYIDGDNGDDTNNGLSLATPYKTFDFLWSGGVNPLPRQINANVTIYCKGTILSVSKAGHLRLNDFYGTGTITIEGAWTDIQTDIEATLWDNDQNSVLKKCFVEASAESWDVDEFKGKFILITSGTGSGTQLCPILSNTATRLETCDLNLLDSTSRFSIIEATKVRGALVSDPATIVEYSDNDLYAAVWLEGISIDVTIKSLDMMELENPLGWNNDVYLGAGAFWESNVNSAYLKIRHISLVTYALHVENRACSLERSVIFLDNAVKSMGGYTSISNSILVGNGVDSKGVELMGSKSDVTLNGCRIINHLAGISEPWGSSVGAALMLNVRNLFENCVTAIDTVSVKLSLEIISASYPSCFLNCTTAFKLAGSTFIIGKTPHFNFDGVTTALQIDEVNTASFDDLIANKAISNSSGGSVSYYDTVAKTTYTPKTVDRRVMSTLDVSSPPTAAELVAEFGTAASVGTGFSVCIDDGGAGTAFYTCTSDGTNWWIFLGLKAV